MPPPPVLPFPARRPRLGLPFAALLGAFALAAVGLDYAPRPGYAWLRELTVWAVVVPAAAGFVVGYRRVAAAPDTPALRRRLLLGAVPLWGLAFAAAPFDSLDLAGYLNCARAEVVYGVNPYVTPVTRIPGWLTDGLFVPIWYDTLCAYGFLFSRLAAVVVTLAGDDRAATYALFKAVNVVALGLTVWLVDRGCRRWRRPRAAAIVLTAWNPLVLVHGLSNGHNDLLVGLGLVAALVAAGSRRWWWAALPALAVAALVKYSTVPVVPLAAVFLVRRHGWVRTAASAGLTAAFCVAVSGPYLAGGSALEVTRNLGNVTTITHSCASVVYYPVEAVAKRVPAAAGAEPATVLALKAAGGLLVLGTVAVLVWRRARAAEYTAAEFARDVVLVQLVLLAVASPKFYSWYVLMVWPAVPLLADGRLRRAGLALAVAQLGGLTFVGKLRVLEPLVLIVAPLLWARRDRPAPPQPAAVTPPAVRQAA